MSRSLRHFEWMMESDLQRRAVALSSALIESMPFPCLNETLNSHWRMRAEAGALPQYESQAKAEMHTGAIVSHCIYQVTKADYPVWVLDEKTARVLMESDLPYDKFVELPRLPHCGMYIEIPEDLYHVSNDQTGLHKAIGIYVVEDWSIHSGEWKLQWIVAVVGEAKGAVEICGEMIPDDALVHFRIEPGKPLCSMYRKGMPSVVPTVAIVVNLMHCWLTRHLRTRKVSPVAPKSPKKVKRAKRRGISFRPYSYVDLFSRESRSSASTRTRSAVESRRGYWNYYWIRDLKDDTSLETREHPTSGNTLHKVARFIAPIVCRTQDKRRTPQKVRL